MRMIQLDRSGHVYRTLRKVRSKAMMIHNGVFGPLPRPKKWVFIVGCTNSGTTLLHNLLAIHPDVGSMPSEGQYYTDELLRPGSIGLPRLGGLKPERFYMDESSGSSVNVNRLKRQWGGQFNNPACPILLEKSPINALRTRWLQKHFDNAHFIGLVRNGYAVAEGIQRKAGHSLELAARQWARMNEIMLDDFAHLNRRKLVRYEALTESPQETLDEILSFLELPPNHVEVAGQVWHVHKQSSSIRNMNARSFEALTEKERKVIEVAAGSMLHRFGYTHSIH